MYEDHFCIACLSACLYVSLSITLYKQWKTYCVECIYIAKTLVQIDSVFISSGFVQLRWTNLNPLELVQKLKDNISEGEAMEQVLIDSGISSGYQEKPCLEPNNPDCPDTAPNKASKQVSVT